MDLCLKLTGSAVYVQRCSLRSSLVQTHFVVVGTSCTVKYCSEKNRPTKFLITTILTYSEPTNNFIRTALSEAMKERARNLYYFFFYSCYLFLHSYVNERNRGVWIYIAVSKMSASNFKSRENLHIYSCGRYPKMRETIVI